MNQVVPSGALCTLIEPVYPKNDGPGRPTVELEQMLRIYYRAENAIRLLVVGCKNWLLCDNAADTDASARLYSLIETAKANGLEPHTYLTGLFIELPKATTLNDIAWLLPFKQP